MCCTILLTCFTFSWHNFLSFITSSFYENCLSLPLLTLQTLQTTNVTIPKDHSTSGNCDYNSNQHKQQLLKISFLNNTWSLTVIIEQNTTMSETTLDGGKVKPYYWSEIYMTYVVTEELFPGVSPDFIGEFWINDYKSNHSLLMDLPLFSKLFNYHFLLAYDFFSILITFMSLCSKHPLTPLFIQGKVEFAGYTLFFLVFLRIHKQSWSWKIMILGGGGAKE